MEFSFLPATPRRWRGRCCLSRRTASCSTVFGQNIRLGRSPTSPTKRYVPMRHSPMSLASDERHPYSVSVVIATAFRAATLERTLRSLALQSLLPQEIVIVDGAPPPGVETLVADTGLQHGLNIVYRRSTPPSAAGQRNAGLKVASGDIFLFLDDDAYPDPDCLEKMIRIFEEDHEERIG